MEKRRVGAILSSSENEVRFLGYGWYVGDHVPEYKEGAGMRNLMSKMDMTNPKIELDNGTVVYGCECWWGPEEKIKEHMEGRNVVEVSIEELFGPEPAAQPE